MNAPSPKGEGFIVTAKAGFKGPAESRLKMKGATLAVVPPLQSETRRPAGGAGSRYTP